MFCKIWLGPRLQSRSSWLWGLGSFPECTFVHWCAWLLYYQVAIASATTAAPKITASISLPIRSTPVFAIALTSLQQARLSARKYVDVQTMHWQPRDPPLPPSILRSTGVSWGGGVTFARLRAGDTFKQWRICPPQRTNAGRARFYGREISRPLDHNSNKNPSIYV
jgi:hypothetical protein